MDAATVCATITLLRRLIPTFECVPGCHDCCGPVPWSRWERAQVPGPPPGGHGACPWLGEDGCTIYRDRPLICRLFGASEEPRLRCPHGRGPGRPLTVAETRRIMDTYLKLMEDNDG